MDQKQPDIQLLKILFPAVETADCKSNCFQKWENWKSFCKFEDLNV